MPIRIKRGHGWSRLPDTISSVLRRERCVHNASASGAGPQSLIASYNVHKCVGVDNRLDPARTARVIAEIDADIIALQEVDRRFGGREGRLDLARIERDCGLKPVPLAPTARGHGWHGNLILFREGVVHDVHQISLEGVEPRGALIVDFDLESGPLRVVAAHFGLLRRCRTRQVEMILATLERRDPRPTLIMGDLNEWRLGARSALNGLNADFGPLAAALPSFPAPFPVFALDRILARPHHMISRLEVHDSPLARLASDHLPLKAQVDMTGAVQALDSARTGEVAA